MADILFAIDAFKKGLYFLIKYASLLIRLLDIVIVTELMVERILKIGILLLVQISTCKLNEISFVRDFDLSSV